MGGGGGYGIWDTDLLGLIGELFPLRADGLGAGHKLVAVADLGTYHVLLAHVQRVGGGSLGGWLVGLGQLDVCENEE